MSCGLRRGLLTGLLLLGCGRGAARAGECAAPAGASAELAERTAEERLRFLQKSLRDTSRSERRFLIGWSLVYAGFIGGTWVLYPFTEDKRGKIIESSWSNAISLLGHAQMTLQPLLVMRDQRRIEALAAQPLTAENRCATLARAEKLLVHAAESERSARTPFAHISGFVINIGLGVILGYGLKRPQAAAMNTTIGVAVSELMIATRPKTAMQRLDRYRAGDLRATPLDPNLLLPMVAPTEGGLSLSLAGQF